jgi:hypothetical protein
MQRGRLVLSMIATRLSSEVLTQVVVAGDNIDVAVETLHRSRFDFE